MARILPDEVRRLAGLARLRLTPEEVERLSTELGEILAHFAALREAEEEGPPEPGTERGAGPGHPSDVGPLRDDGPATPLRDDVPDPDPLLRPPSEGAPRWAGGFFLVPRPPGLSPASAADHPAPEGG